MIETLNRDCFCVSLDTDGERRPLVACESRQNIAVAD